MTIAKSRRATAKKAPDASRTKAKTGSTAGPATAETKTDLVLKLLRRNQGALLAELVEATGWLPHTTRAALAGLRKKGHALEKTRRKDATCYRIAAA
jgi:hypothetical protein